MADCCNDFKAHQLRPNKCKNCFGDKLRHKSATPTESPASLVASEQGLSNDQLLAELAKCQAEKQDSLRIAEQCQRDLAELRAKLEAGKLGPAPEEADHKQVIQLREQLDLVRAERDQARQDLRLLEGEMEEMHDNFKEEESEQFERVKQELDGAVKDCKILQIRLAKSERQYVQLEQVKTMLERQLAEKSSIEADVKRPQVSEPVNTNSSDWLRVSAAEYDQLLRDLNDTSERERDLQEQIKFSQEEAQAKHERLQVLEVENELLMTRLAGSNQREPARQLEADQQLSLELAQSECQRLQARRKELAASLETKELRLKDCEANRERLEAELNNLRSASSDDVNSSVRCARLEHECRQLRLRLVRTERECKQLKAQQEYTDQIRTRGERQPSQSIKDAKDTKLVRKSEQPLELDQQQSQVESDLIDGLKKRLESSEAELVRARARLVELDLQCSRAQRQHKRLIESLAANTGEMRLCKRIKLPEESARDSMSRQELRQALRALEDELTDYAQLLSSKDCLIRELRNASPRGADSEPAAAGQDSELRNLLEQECESTNLLRRELSSLTERYNEVQLNLRMLEHERKAMEDEVDKLRQVNNELRTEREAAREDCESLERKLKEAQVGSDKMRIELATQVRNSGQKGANQEVPNGSNDNLLLMARDLNELRAKNSFLARELEMAREEAANQLDELKRTQENQQRRAVELAQLELKDKQLAETQVIRDELNELKQRLAASQRQISRADDELSNERERTRALERDWRRDKSQWQQRAEQLEAQLTIERRSSDFKVKEIEASVREKERQLLSLQESYVQLERDYKRSQNKIRMLEDESESRIQSLTRELDSKKRELANQVANERTRDEQSHDSIKRLNAERATLSEALESVRRSYEEKSAEARSLRQQLQTRQDQAYKDRLSSQENIDSLVTQLAKAAERDVQAKLQGQQLEMRERQLESMRREAAQLKESGSKIRMRCEELERRCQHYEKQELATKTSSISPAAALFRTRAPSFQVGLSATSAASRQQQKQQLESPDNSASSTVDKLTGKVNDQRHLINMLRQQHEESQLELRQLQLLRTAERSNWESRLTLLTSRLAECEERLLFETTDQLSPDMMNQANRKLETRWADERRSVLETVKQQSLRCEQLIRDFKKLSQSHELLRHQARQLQAHNNKLSRKLIELQQVGRPAGSPDLPARLATCETERMKLKRLIEEQARPLVETVTKILASLDASDKSSAPPQSGTPSSSGYTSATQSTSRPLGVSSPSAAPESESSEAAPTSRLSRLLGKQSKTVESDKTDKKTVVRRVRVKSAALGISATERRQLRSQLDQLKIALGEYEDQDALSNLQTQDSDLESERNSQTRWDEYRRSPKCSPASRSSVGASLTDYDSDLSIASGYAGAESDSGGQHSRVAKSRKRGLKTRITSTLRSLSRSITTGLASDSESEQATTRVRASSDLREISV